MSPRVGDAPAVTPETHTPGPWTAQGEFVDPTPVNAVVASDGDGFHSIARTFGPPAKANARLIAAAPDLLEALKNAQSALALAIRANLSRDLYDSEDEYNAAVRAHPVLADARDAIAKAERGQS